MDENLLRAEWLDRWRETVNAELDALDASFEEAYGYRPDANFVRAADEADRRAGRALAQNPVAAADLDAFYDVIGEVLLPDIGEGLIIHPARRVLDRLAADGAAVIPDAADPHGVIFGTDGEGKLFAADWGGAIHRSKLPNSQLAFEQVASDLHAFLDQVRDGVTRFVATGEVLPL